MNKLFFILFFSAESLYAQLPGSYHASLLGLGNSGVAGQDLSQIWSNCAGVEDTQRAIMTSACQPFSTPGMNQYSAALLLPWKTSACFLRTASYGNTIYRRTWVGMGGLHHAGSSSWFVSADYLQEKIEGFDGERAMLLSAGAQFEFSSHWRAGAKAESISLLHKREMGERMNVAAGLSWRPTPGLSCMVDWQQQKGDNSALAIGILYQYSSALAFRCGWRGDVFSLSAGMSVKWKNFRLDYGFRYQPAPGMTHALSLNCYW